MPEESAGKEKDKSRVLMGGSLGSLPTENLLQMIGNLKLSTRLLLERKEKGYYFLMTFREGELVPHIESSHYPTLKQTLERDREVDQRQLADISAAYPETPLWNRVLAAGIVDRHKLKRYLVEGIKKALGLFADLSGVHFELSPVSAERLGRLSGFRVAEITALARKPREVPEPPPKPSPRDTKASGDSGQEDKKDGGRGEDYGFGELLKQLRETVSGALACYIVEVEGREVKSSALAPSLARNRELDSLNQQVCRLAKLSYQAPLKTRETYLYTQDYLVGMYRIKQELCLVALCGKDSPLGLLLTAMRKAGRRARELTRGETE